MTPEEFARAPLSAVIRVALDDLAKVEADATYEVHMGCWHDAEDGGPCYVCLAGAVMAGTFFASPGADLDPDFYQFDVSARLYALDRLCRGQVTQALKKLGIPALRLRAKVWPTVTPYERDPAAFRRDLLAIAEALEKEGL